MSTFPQTPAEARICVHGNRVWFGHECGLCDAEGEHKWLIYGPVTRIREGFAQWGDKFDASSLLAADESIQRAYASKQRVKVINARYGDVRTGVVSTTTGWKPAFLLMYRSNAYGSSDLLGPDDYVSEVWTGRRYEPVQS